MVGVIMDLRNADEVTQQKELIDRMLSRVNTCIPGVIEKFDSATQTVNVRPAIQLRTRIDEVVDYITLPKIINAPVIFPFAITAGFALTLPVRAGDPCIILFSQRAIDNWQDRGGIQPPEDGFTPRHHDLTDALVMLAAPPAPNALVGWEGNGIQLRNADQSTTLTIRDAEAVMAAGNSVLTIPSTGAVTLTSGASVSITSPVVNIDGDVNITGSMTATVGATIGGIEFGTHVHTGVQPGSGNTGGPV